MKGTLSGTRFDVNVDQLWKVKQEVGLQRDLGCIPFIQPVPFDRGHPFSQPYRADSFPRGGAEALALRKARSGGVGWVLMGQCFRCTF